MLARLRFNICDISTSYKWNADIENIEDVIRDHIPDSLSYACRLWARHVSRVADWTESEALRDFVSVLLSERVLEWLEVMSLTETVPLDSLRELESAQQVLD